MNEPYAEIEAAAGLFQAVGTVIETGDGDGEFSVLTERGLLRARPAFSCLVVPEEGDRVLLAGPDDAETWVLAVLTRPGSGAMRMRAAGDVSFGVREGRFRVVAERGIELSTGGDLSLTAPKVAVRSREGHLVIDRITVLGGSLLARIRRVKFVGDLLDAVLTRLFTRAKRSYRVVEETETVRAGEIDQSAERNVTIRSKNTIIFSQELVKMDGSQIHLG